ncbi:hypothetical protein QJR26_08790 [Clostridium baratii]
MKSDKILKIIPKLEKLKDPKDLELVIKAIDSCLTVQTLKENYNKKIS